MDTTVPQDDSDDLYAGLTPEECAELDHEFDELAQWLLDVYLHQLHENNNPPQPT